MELTQREKLTADISNEIDSEDINNFIYVKYVELKKNNPDWTDYKCKLYLKKRFNVTTKEINAIPFFRDLILRKKREYELSGKRPNQTYMPVERQEKLYKECHYDKGSIITKGIVSSGRNQYDVHSNLTAKLKGATSVYFRYGRGFQNV